MMYFETGRQVPLMVGANILDRLSGLQRELDAASVLIVADAGVVDAGLVKRVQTALGTDVPVEGFTAPGGEPTVATVDAGAAAVRALDRPLVIGLGGGSALDIAKLLAALAVSPGSMDDYVRARTPWAGRTPAVMIPTTSGTGSEVTRTSIVADEAGRKQWAWGDELLPDVVLLDAALTCSLPPAMTVATGLDAFVHALEAATSQGRHPLIEAPALQAIRLIGQSLPRAVVAPDDMTARQQTQFAACLAGQAIDNGGTGLGHNIGHALGTLYHLPHGVAVALAVEATLAWSVAGNETIFAPAAEALDRGATPEELPALFSSLADGAGFSAALAPFADLRVDARALADTMQADENAPMANNAARRPQADDWLKLAETTAALFERRTGVLATEASLA